MQSCLTKIRASFLLLVPLTLALGACVTPQSETPTESTGFLPASGLDAVQPVDIAVAPVTVALLDGGTAPTDAVREALYGGLIHRLYSPLPLAWVDADGERDATLVVRILQWDRSKLNYDGTILARAEARLVAGGESLWAVELTRRLNRSTSGQDRDEPGLAEASCARHLAAEVLALLPEHDARRR